MNYELCQLIVLCAKYGVSDLIKLLLEEVMLQLFFISFDFFILHQHQSDGEVEDEKGTNPDHGDEVKVDECCHVNILVDVHDLGPAV